MSDPLLFSRYNNIQSWDRSIDELRAQAALCKANLDRRRSVITLSACGLVVFVPLVLGMIFRHEYLTWLGAYLILIIFPAYGLGWRLPGEGRERLAAQEIDARLAYMLKMTPEFVAFDRRRREGREEIRRRNERAKQEAEAKKRAEQEVASRAARIAAEAARTAAELRRQAKLKGQGVKARFEVTYQQWRYHLGLTQNVTSPVEVLGSFVQNWRNTPLATDPEAWLLIYWIDEDERLQACRHLIPPPPQLIGNAATGA